MCGADGPDGEWWYVVNVPLEKGEPPGQWSLYRRLPLPAGRDLALIFEGEFGTREEAFAAAEERVLHPTLGDEIRRVLARREKR